MGEKFDATSHLIKLKGGRDYLPVAWRLLWLRTEQPDAIIETDMVRLDEGYAVFKAKVSIPTGGSATGYGSETKGDFPDFLEKAETKALGRALGALGYGTQFTEDFEESGAIADSPIERPQRQASAQEARTPPKDVGTAPPAERAAQGKATLQPSHDNRLAAWARDQGITSPTEPAIGVVNGWLHAEYRTSIDEFRSLPQAMRDNIMARLRPPGGGELTIFDLQVELDRKAASGKGE